MQRFLLKGRENYHIAPLLQVNMELLWERRLHNGAVIITQHELQNIIDHQEGLLDHYMKKVREQISEGIADDFKVLQLMNAYVQDEPASSTCLDKALLGRKPLDRKNRFSAGCKRSSKTSICWLKSTPTTNPAPALPTTYWPK
ncbi:MAG: hypothetical protein IPH16_10175 [Haliscomenobacter sp.]|nr:hypothetical protein [Haliscomenobacter sp.]